MQNSYTVAARTAAKAAASSLWELPGTSLSATDSDMALKSLLICRGAFGSAIGIAHVAHGA